MSDQVFRMTTGHVVGWTIFYCVFVGLWTWSAVTARSGAERTISVVVVLLVLRGLIGSLVAFVRRPSLELGPDALAVTEVVRTRVERWAECSAFRVAQTWSGGHVRYHDGRRRRSLPAGFGDADRRLSADELADALNRARDAASAEVGSVTS